MKILIPIDENNVELTNVVGVTPSLFPTWSSATAYAIGARVSVASTVNGQSRSHDYEAVLANTNVDPVTNHLTPGASWVMIGLSNRYKVIDRIISDPAITDGGLMTYQFAVDQNVTTVALFGLVGSTVTISILDSTGVVIPGTTEVRNIDGNPNIGNWFEYFFSKGETIPDLIFTGMPAYAGNQIQVTIESGGRVEIGEIVFGEEIEIGTTLEKPTFGIRDYSRKERDAFGRPIIVERPYSIYGEFNIVYPSDRTRNLLRQLAAIRAKPAVFYVEGVNPGRGTMIFGFYNDFSMNLEIGEESNASITVEGLV